MRRALIGAIVAIFALLPCLGFGYPAGARSSKGHHAQCANAARSKAKRAKRRAKCKKPRKSAQRRTRVAQKVGRSAPATKPSAASTTPVGMPTTAGPAPAAPSGTAPTTTGPAPAAPSGTAPTTTVRPPSSPTPTTPTRTPAEERELSEAKAEHTSAAEALAQELLGELLLPQGAVQVASEPGLGTPAPFAGLAGACGYRGATGRCRANPRSSLPGSRRTFRPALGSPATATAGSRRDEMVCWVLLPRQRTRRDLE